MPSQRVWIVDDLVQTRVWLRQAVEIACPDASIHEAGGLLSARQLALNDGWPTLALVDLGLPDGRGTSLIEDIIRIRPNTLVLIPTIFDDDAYLFDAIVAGADGYLLKEQPIPRLATQLRALIAGGVPPMSPPLARRILRTLDPTDDTQAAARQYLLLRARGVPSEEALAQSAATVDDIRQALRALRSETADKSGSG